MSSVKKTVSAKRRHRREKRDTAMAILMTMQNDPYLLFALERARVGFGSDETGSGDSSIGLRALAWVRGATSVPVDAEKDSIKSAA